MLQLLWIRRPASHKTHALLHQRWHVALYSNPEQATGLFASGGYDAALVTGPFEDWSLAEILETLLAADPRLPVVVESEVPTLDEAVQLTRLGAYEYFGSDVSPERLLNSLELAGRQRAAIRDPAPRNAAPEPWRQSIVGQSAAMEAVAATIRLVGPRRSTVLVAGETGTGKELIARAIHHASPRANKPLISVNCSALPENLLEAELFGHTRGAFTGALQSRAGRFETAHGGTLFLDEIGDMALEIQSKLLRALQEREFQRLGSSETVKVDVRVIAATNCDLAQRVVQGKFREDLYYRLNVVPISLPPLRERSGDITELVTHFLQKICDQEDLPRKSAARAALDLLCAYEWPGNVRQLENAIERAVVLSGERAMLLPADFHLPAARNTSAAPARFSLLMSGDGIDFERTVGRVERDLLSQALNRAGGNKKRAADLLRLKRTTLTAKLKALDLESAACARASAS
jgi:DNA-binding NtrC family response regulator